MEGEEKEPIAAAAKKKRPVVITVICVLMGLGAALAIPLAMSDTARDVGSWYPPVLLLTSVVGIASLVGLWQMKRWAPILYTGMTAAVQVILIAQGAWRPGALLIPLVVIFLSFSQFGNMD